MCADWRVRRAGEAIDLTVTPRVMTEGQRTFGRIDAAVGTMPERVVVRGLDPEGRERVYTATELLARAFCHEIDHIDGLHDPQGYLERLQVFLAPACDELARGEQESYVLVEKILAPGEALLLDLSAFSQRVFCF